MIRGAYIRGAYIPGGAYIRDFTVFDSNHNYKEKAHVPSTKSGKMQFSMLLAHRLMLFTSSWKRQVML